MAPNRYQLLLDRLSTTRNTDELFDLELAFAPLDEEDTLTRRALFQFACRRCDLARGPAPSPERFALERPAPAMARCRFEVRGRMGSRIVRVGWADGQLFGSLFGIGHIEADGADLRDAADAERRIRASFDVVLEEMRIPAVA